MLEVEQKFRVADVANVVMKLEQLGFRHHSTESHIDIYLRHPARDFAVSGEALRIRKIGEQCYVTYKGKRLEGEVKIRPEIELPIGGSEQEWLSLWQNLGFSIAEQVRKTRKVMTSEDHDNLTIAVDSVEKLGNFIEIEVLVKTGENEKIAASLVNSIATKVGLDQVETRSYLRQILELEER